MKLYIITSGLIFALIAVAHIARMATESNVIREPLFLVLTLIAAGLSIWAFVVLRRASN